MKVSGEKIPGSEVNMESKKFSYEFDKTPLHRDMTLRDYFAAKAMLGLMTMCSAGAHTIENDEHLAIQAYGVADAMLKERNR